MIARNFEKVHDMLFNKKGHIYICGDVRMAADVTNEIELGLKQKYKISIEEAKVYINEMRVKIYFLFVYYYNNIVIIIKNRNQFAFMKIYSEIVLTWLNNNVSIYS